MDMRQEKLSGFTRREYDGAGNLVSLETVNFDEKERTMNAATLQHKMSDTLYIEQRPYIVNANDKAIEIARRLHGLYDWNGVLGDGIYGPSGLKRLANAWLRKHTSGGAIVVEVELGDRSHYYPSWK